MFVFGFVLVLVKFFLGGGLFVVVFVCWVFLVWFF